MRGVASVIVMEEKPITALTPRALTCSMKAIAASHKFDRPAFEVITKVFVSLTVRFGISLVFDTRMSLPCGKHICATAG